jgi:hypothetical protein
MDMWHRHTALHLEKNTSSAGVAKKIPALRITGRIRIEICEWLDNPIVIVFSDFLSAVIIVVYSSLFAGLCL